MVQVPLRGLFLLGRAAFVVAAAAAVPYILKKNKRLGDQLGDALIKAGENLKDGPSPRAAAPKTSQTVKTSPKKDATRKATAPAANTAAKAKAKPKRKTSRKKTSSKKPAAASPPAE